MQNTPPPTLLEEDQAILTEESVLFVLDMTSGLRFEAKREIINKSVILPILKLLIKKRKDSKLKVAFASLTGSTHFGLSCNVLKSFNACDIPAIEHFLSKDIDRLVDFGQAGESLTGSFGIGATVEAICTALCHFPSADTKNHLILLPTSAGTEALPPFRTCPDDQYSTASLPVLLTQLRAKKISLSLVAPGLTDSTVVEQFIVFKCNEKIGTTSKLTESLGLDWVVRLSASLTGEDTIIPAVVDETELLNQILVKLSTMPPDERVVALKTMLDPATSTFSSSFRQKFAAAVKSRLQPDPASANVNMSMPASPVPAVRSTPTFPPRRASHDSSTVSFWNGCIRFLEKQQYYLFRTQFQAVDSQTPLPRASLENWPQELNLTGLLDSKKESIQAGLSVGYAFKVNIANADTAVASYLMQRMCQGNTNTPSHLACFRISQDVLIMLRILSLEDLQFVGYLIDRRFPKNNLSSAAQAASNAINSLTATKTPMSTTLSTGMEGLSLMNSGRRPSFDVKMSNFPAKAPQTTQQMPPIPQMRPQAQQNQTPSASQPSKPMTTNYLSYPQFIQQQQQQMQQQKSPAKIAAISNTATSNSQQLLTDPQAILQKLRPQVQQQQQQRSPEMSISMPAMQPNESSGEDLDQSFVDAWLN